MKKRLTLNEVLTKLNIPNKILETTSLAEIVRAHFSDKFGSGYYSTGTYAGKVWSRVVSIFGDNYITDESDETCIRAFKKIIVKLENNYKRYDTLMTNYEANQSKLMDSLKSSNVMKFNDTPQIAEGVDEDPYTSTITKSESESNTKDVMEKLNTINSLYEDCLTRWARDFYEIFIDPINDYAHCDLTDEMWKQIGLFEKTLKDLAKRALKIPLTALGEDTITAITGGNVQQNLKLGAGLAIEDGYLVVTGGDEQSDWDEQDEESLAYIKNKPAFINLLKELIEIVENTITLGGNVEIDGDLRLNDAGNLTDMDGNPLIPESSIPWYLETEKLTSADIGVEKELTINGKVHKVRLIGIDHDDLADGSGKAHTTWEFVTLLSKADGTAKTNKWGDDNLNYPTSYIANYLNTSVLNLMPTLLQLVIKQVTKSVATAESAGTAFAATNFNTKLFLLSLNEMGRDPVSITEGTTYSYYSTSRSLIKKDFSGTAKTYWTRSPHTNYIYCQNIVKGITSDAYGTDLTCTSTIFSQAPCFCI